MSLIVVFGTGRRGVCCSCCGCHFWRQLGQGDWDIQFVLGLSGKGAVPSVIYHSAALPVLLRLRQPRVVSSGTGWARSVSFVTKSSSRAIPSQQQGELSRHCRYDCAARAGPALLHALPQSGALELYTAAVPCTLTRMEALEFGKDFLSKIWTVWPRMEWKGKAETPNANREEILLQSSFQNMP